MRKEAKPFIIGFWGIFLNFPIALILYFLAPNLIEKVFLFLVPFELILIGILSIKMDYDFNKNETKGLEMGVGTIKKFEFVLVNDSWLKAPIIHYVVDTKEYLKPAILGINGILNKFLINKKIKIYYDKDNPDIMFVKDPIFTIVGGMFIIVGIIILCVY